MFYFCCDDRRRIAVERSSLNGIDFLEVDDRLDLPPDQRQRSLLVHFIKPLATGALNERSVRIEGGERIKGVKVVKAEIGSGDQAKILTVTVDAAGDFSTYTLRLIKDLKHPQPPGIIDPALSSVQFSFKVECPTDFDCETNRVCPPERRDEPEIDYLSKDYAGFRQLMLDRLSVLSPAWTERHPADIGVTLVELLAYVGDYLSYRQDAIATEAYLGTARRRVSVRRHARLIDHRMHDGRNARVLVQVQAAFDNVRITKGSQLLTLTSGQPSRIDPGSADLNQALAARPVVFETMDEAVLFQSHYRMSFYTWGALECCLPKGATRAALRGGFPELENAVVIFEEVLGPDTGSPADADPSHRHAVRLTRVSVTIDPLGGLFESAYDTGAVAVTEIEWGAEDALPFPLCISSRLSETAGRRRIKDVTIALGNIVLADHGQTISDEELPPVQGPVLFRAPSGAGSRCKPEQPAPIFPRYRPRLKESPVTQAAGGAGRQASAYALMHPGMGDVLPEVILDAKWTARRDLMGSGEFDKHFVVEVEGDGVATLRFGDDQHGARPAEGASFKAAYRVGNGVAGNIGAESLAHIVSNDHGVIGVRNPLPAGVGVEPETIEHVRRIAPGAFRAQERAVTLDDYAEITTRHGHIQQAAATLRWTGSWPTVFVSIDRLGGLPVDEPFKRELRGYLDRFKMAGSDVEVDGPRFVPLEIEMLVCVNADYFRGNVKESLLETFSNRILPNGRRGLFHPDNFTFGQPVYLSPLYAAAQAAPGVDSIDITTFQRQGSPSNIGIEDGKLMMNRLEIARLDNDPNFPDRGVFRLKLRGGK